MFKGLWIWNSTQRRKAKLFSRSNCDDIQNISVPVKSAEFLFSHNMVFLRVKIVTSKLIQGWRQLTGLTENTYVYFYACVYVFIDIDFHKTNEITIYTLYCWVLHIYLLLHTREKTDMKKLIAQKIREKTVFSFYLSYCKTFV